MGQSTTSETIPAPPEPRPETRGPVNHELLALLEQWMAEDATDDPEAILRAEREIAEFKRAMNENRILAGELPLFP